MLFLTAAALTFPIIPLVEHHHCYLLLLVAVGNGQNPYGEDVCRRHSSDLIQASSLLPFSAHPLLYSQQENGWKIHFPPQVAISQCAREPRGRIIVGIDR